MQRSVLIVDENSESKKIGGNLPSFFYFN